ncbi:ABC transporter substrate-binding protein [Chloroflexota bacterium]
MVRSKISGLLISAVTMVLVIALLLSVACAGGAPAPEEKSIKIGQVAIATGPVADAGYPMAIAFSDWVNWINEHGGLDGVKIDYKWIESGYEAPRAVAAYQRLTDWGVTGYYSCGTVCNDAIRELAKQDGMPIVTAGGAAEQYFPTEGSVFFSMGQPHTAEARAGLLWLMRNLPELPKKPKVAIIRPDDAYGWSFANGVLSYQDVDGYEIVADEKLAHGALDATTAARNAINAGADVIGFMYTPGTGAVVMRDARRVGFKGPLVALHTSTIDYSIGELSEGAAEGAYFNTYKYLLEDKRPGMEPVFDMLKAYHPDLNPLRPYNPMDVWSMGINSMEILANGLKAAINKVGVDNVDRTALWEGLETLSNLDLFGQQTISYSPTDHNGGEAYGMYQWQNNRFNLVGDFGPPPAIADWERQGNFKWK